MNLKVKVNQKRTRAYSEFLSSYTKWSFAADNFTYEQPGLQVRRIKLHNLYCRDKQATKKYFSCLSKEVDEKLRKAARNYHAQSNQQTLQN